MAAPLSHSLQLTRNQMTISSIDQRWAHRPSGREQSTFSLHQRVSKSQVGDCSSSAPPPWPPLDGKVSQSLHKAENLNLERKAALSSARERASSRLPIDELAQPSASLLILLSIELARWLHSFVQSQWHASSLPLSAAESGSTAGERGGASFWLPVSRSFDCN